MGTRGAWSRDFARALGNTNPSAQTINWISAWTAKEGTRAKYNPLATTYDLPPNTEFNSAGVKNFETRQQGIDATVRTLMGNHQGYEAIREGIRTNNPEMAADGLIAAPWGTNGGAVKNLWRMSDTTGTLLLSEGESESSSIHGGNPDTILPVQSHGVHSGSGASATPDDSEVQGYTLGTQAYLYIGAGVVLIMIALFLAVKTFVPVTQIVKTAAIVAK